MRRRRPKVKAIPTTFKTIRFRSRLEARWACFLDALQWRWEYEPDLQAGYVLPDFVLTDFNRPVVLECKPAVTVGELEDERRRMISRMSDWLKQDVERELKVLKSDRLTSDSDLIEETFDDFARINHGLNPRGHTRRVYVVGPALHPIEDHVTLDGEIGFCLCEDAHGKHVGLSTELGDHCLRCGFFSVNWLDPELLLEAWRQAGNQIQWQSGGAK